MRNLFKKVAASAIAATVMSTTLVNNASAEKMNVGDFEINTRFEENGLMNMEITKYNGNSKRPEIAPVYSNKYRTQGIQKDAFNNKSLSSVTLPNTLAYVMSSSFSQNQLEEIIIPESLTFIGSNAFGNNKLKAIYVPDSVTTIEKNAFNKNQIETFRLPNGMTEIPNGLFWDNEISELTLPETVKIIGPSAFHTNKLTTVRIPEHIERVDQNAFYQNEINSLTLSNSVEIITRETFRYNKLTSLNIPSVVSTIQDYAFADNLLTTVKIPKSVTEISPTAFANNPSGLKIIGEEGSYAEQYAKDNGFLFDTKDEETPTEPEGPSEPENPEQPETPNTGDTEAQREIEANIVTGDLTLNAPTNKTFGNIELGNQPKVVKTGLNGPVQVSDLRGTQEGWRLDVSATQFEIVEPTGGFAEGTTGHKLPKGSLSLGAVNEIKRVGTGSSTLPVANQSSNKIIDDGSITVATAAKGTGMGDFDLLFDDNTYSLVVDATTAKVDMVNYPDGKTPYKASVTWNLVSAP